jgi:hypothetical protein
VVEEDREVVLTSVFPLPRSIPQEIWQRISVSSGIAVMMEKLSSFSAIPNRSNMSGRAPGNE